MGTKIIIFGTSIAITLFAAAFLGIMIPNVEANHGPNPLACIFPPGAIFDPNSNSCVLPEDCEFGVDRTTVPAHCNSTPPEPITNVGDFTCYSTFRSLSGPTITLTDQFVENEQVTIKSLRNVCASADKEPRFRGGFPPPSQSPFGIVPGHHLITYEFDSPIILPEPITVTIENQFGTFEDVEVSQARTLIVPAFKPEDFRLPPPGTEFQLDQHWLCWDVRYPFFNRSTLVTDQFVSRELTQVTDGLLLCNPVIKQLESGETFPPETDRHMTCHRANWFANPEGRLFVDQFGIYFIQSARPSLICVDSIKIIQPTNQDPICTAAVPSEPSLWPPNHKFVDISISGVTDPDGDPVTITVDAITQDEPTNGLGDGDKSPDGTGVGTDTAEVRSERSGLEDGRVYEISFTADDGNGGMCSGSVFVGVPHDKKDTAVDSGQNFDSTQP